LLFEHFRAMPEKLPQVVFETVRKIIVPNVGILM